MLSKERSTFSTIEYLDSIIDLTWEELEDGIRNAKAGVVAGRYSTNIQEYKVMTFIAIGAIGVMHSTVSSPAF